MLKPAPSSPPPCTRVMLLLLSRSTWTVDVPSSREPALSGKACQVLTLSPSLVPVLAPASVEPAVSVTLCQRDRPSWCWWYVSAPSLVADSQLVWNCPSASSAPFCKKVKLSVALLSTVVVARPSSVEPC